MSRFSAIRKILYPLLPSKYQYLLAPEFTKYYLKEYIEKQCLFIHIPKTGGSAICTALFSKFPFHFTAEEYKALNPEFFNSFYKFSIVRNPCGISSRKVTRIKG